MQFDASNLVFGLVQYVCLLFSLCFHEAAHAVIANWRGDPTAKFLGRATMNPLAHIDPIGTVIMPLLMMTTGIPFLFGWAKPVPINPRNLRDLRRDPAWIAAAGPGSNVLLAVTFALLLKVTVVLAHFHPAFELLFIVFFLMVMINLALALFNLIPVPPLDGGHLLYPLLPRGGQRVLEQIGPFGILIAILVGRHVLHGPLEFLRDMVLWFAFLGVD